MTTEKTTRVPRNAEAITAGALSLTLQERVDLVIELKKSIDDEVADVQLKSTNAAKIAAALTAK